MLDRRIALFILSFTFYTTTAIAQNDTRVCYDASNRVSSDLRPCVSPSTQEISHCCSTADTCIGDTLCLSQWGTLFVGGCTVKDWVNGANGRNFCPKYCSSAGKDIGVCENANGGWDFCCGLLGGHENCCAEKYGRRFKITGNATNTLLVQRPWNNSTIGPTITSAPVSSSTSSSAASQCPTPNNNKSAQIGLGAGLGVALIILLCLFLWENRQRRRLEKSLKAYAGAAGYIQYSPEQMSQSQGYQTVTAYEVDNLKGVRNELSNLQQVHELAHDDRGPT